MGKKISQLTAITGSTFADADIFEISVSSGGAFVSRKITGAQIKATIPSGITINSTTVTSGTSGRVLFENTGVVKESANFYWDDTNARLSLGQGSSPGAVLDVRAAGALSTDLALRVRNSANTQDLLKIQGDGSFTFKSNLGEQIISYNGASLAIGQGASLTNANAADIIYGAAASIGTYHGTGSKIVLGYGAAVSGSYGYAIGQIASVTGGLGMAFGYSSQSTNDGSVAIGAFSRVSGYKSIQLSATDSGTNTNSIASSLQVSTGCTPGGRYQNFFVNLNSNVVLRSNTELTSGTHYETAATNVLTIHNGTSPLSNITDAIQFYSKDRGGTAGKASAHFRCEDGTINVLGDLSGFGTSSPGARIDVIAQGALSTDIAFRVRNSADSANLLSIDGTGKLTLAFGGDTTKININGNCTGQVSTAIYGTAGLRSTAVGASTSAIYDAVAVGYSVSTGAGYGVGFGHTISGGGISIGRDIINNNGNISIGFSNTISGDGNGVTLLGRGMSDLSPYTETKNTHTLAFGSYATTGNKPALTFRSNNLNQLLLGYYSTDAQYSTATGSNWLGVKTGTEPSGQTDAFQMYSKDIVAGNAAPHFRTEAGDIVKLYKETTAVTSATITSPGAGSNIKSDDTFDGYTLAQVVKALRNLGILA